MNSLENGTSLKVASIKYVSIFGKTFIDETSSEYMHLKKFAGDLITHNLGVIHGGYIGMMKAIAEGANDVIEKEMKSPNLNIGIPEDTFELHNVQKSKASHTVPAKGIMERVDTLIRLSNFIVVAERGGFGTLLETIATVHLNQLNKKFGGEVRPLIFVGLAWKELFNTIVQTLDMNQQDPGLELIHFVSTYDEALEIIKSKI